MYNEFSNWWFDAQEIKLNISTADIAKDSLNLKSKFEEFTMNLALSMINEGTSVIDSKDKKWETLFDASNKN